MVPSRSARMTGALLLHAACKHFLSNLMLFTRQPKFCWVVAVLVWLNYKNAYEYWMEQRLALNREVQTATHQVLLKLPLAGHHPQHTAAQATAPTQTGTLFLQLTVEDLGICLPMNQMNQVCGT